MPRFISDDMAETAIGWLSDNAAAAAAARANRERMEYKLKRVKSKLILEADGTQQQKEAQALCSPEYDIAMDAYLASIEADEHFRNQTSKVNAILDAWRTCTATERAFGKVA